MINGEEKFLKTAIGELKGIVRAHPDAPSFYRELDGLKDFSLQKVSFESDLRFFDEVNALLGVIAGIIVHPHIVNATEEIVVRATETAALTNEMFFSTLRDARLWKEKRGEMVPENVYYIRNIDEIKTYENRFVVHLVDGLAARLGEYAAFYSFLVGTVEGGLSESRSETERAFGRIDTLSKKIRRIKETSFYREVSKAPTNFARVEPTNMLLKNRAYGACYKFYVKHALYGDRAAVIADLTAFYTVHAMGALKSLGYALKGEGAVFAAEGEALALNGPLAFEKGAFTVLLERAEGGLYVTVTNGRCAESGARTAKHLLVFDPSVTFAGTEREIEKYSGENVVSAEALSPWNMACLEGGLRILNADPVSERQWMTRYFTDKTRMISASRSIYETHCPVCRGREVRVHAGVYRCAHCRSEYAFAADGDENAAQYVWLRKRKR